MVRSRSTSVKSAPEREDFNVLFGAWLLSRAAGSFLDEVLAPAGLTADEFGVYSILADAGDMTPTELARWMAAPPTTVSSYVKRFESRGHVERSSNPRDSRSFRMRLTTAGRQAHHQAAALFGPALDRVVAVLEGQEGDVHRSLRDLCAAIDRTRTPEREPSLESGDSTRRP
jgi:DNA-binding MarR family transcriptional regulator